jgi:deazaflavin-dependent oxidoreductase (nitroreductase family)
MAAVPGLDRIAALAMSRLTGDAVLQVRGRRTSRLRTTLARTINVDGKRYVVAIRGETNWARNLRAAGQALLRVGGKSQPVTAVEVHDDERAAVIAAFVASSKYAPTRRILTDLLPNPDEHPVFRIENL